MDDCEAWAIDMLALFKWCRSGMGGAGHLPFEGGVADQPCIVMEAIGMMESFHSTITAKDAKPYTEDGEIDWDEISRIAEAKMDAELGIGENE